MLSATLYLARFPHATVPFFSNRSKNNVIGLLFVKDLIFIDPEDETPIRSFVQIFGRGVHVVWPVDKLGDVLRELKQGRSHLALVRDVVSDGETDPFYIIKGIITLEGKSAASSLALLKLLVLILLIFYRHCRGDSGARDCR